jgi:photosystem II stability/assembly factor-like uncharacterized protein
MKSGITTTLISFFVISTLYSQRWTLNVPENSNYFEIVQAFDQYWKDKPAEKGQGIKQFKRWEYYWSTRLDKDGKMVSPAHTWNEYENYWNQLHTSGKEFTSGANWEFFGPSSTPGGYEGLGRLNCIAFHPTNNSTFWVGSPGGGLWRTTNNGQTWTPLTDNLPVVGVSDVVIDPANPNILYIATGDGDLGVGLASFDFPGDTKSMGVLKSTNGGNSWNFTGLRWNLDQNKTIRRLWINPSDPRILVATTSDGIYRTSNAGSTWTRTQTGHFMDLEQKPTVNTLLYATSYNKAGGAGIWVSNNGGITWTNKAYIQEVSRIELAVTKSLPNLVDAIGVNLESGMDGLYYSDNNGETWQRYFDSDESSNLLHNSYNASGKGGQGNYDLAYAINPNNSDEILLGGVNTWKSTDGGSNWFLNNFWTSFQSQNPNQVQVVHADKHFIAFHPRVNRLVYECNDGGLYVSTNSGVNWQDISNGLGISQIYRIAVSQNASNNVLIGMQDNGSRTFRNNRWNYATGGDGMDCAIDYSNSNIQYGCYVYGVIYRTLDGWNNQNNVVEISRNIPEAKRGAWLTPIAINPQNPKIIYAAYDDVWASLDRGDSWFRLSFGLTGGTPLNSMVVATANPNFIYVATRDKVYATTNSGQSWNVIAQSGEPITYLEVDPNNPNRVYVALGGYTVNEKVYVSPDGGRTWINYSGSLPNVPVNCIIYEKGSNEGLYVGTDIGVFYTDGSKSDWEPFQTGLPNVVIGDLDISYQDRRIWAGTYGRGVWRSKIASAVSTHDVVRSDFLIYPIPGDGHFTVELPDGVIPSYFELVDLSGGRHLYCHNLNGSSKFKIQSLAPCGTYAARITTDKGVFQQKVIIQD